MAPGSGDEEAVLAERVATLAISDPRLTARTVSLEAVAPTLADDGGAPSDMGELPHITVDGRAAGSLAPRARGRPDYAIVSTIGEGGMGRVHLARQRSLARDVAVKTLKPGAAPAVAHALLREARLTGMLEHPGVIPVHALGVDDDGRPMLVMKRVDGVDLARRLGGEPASGGALVECLEILVSVCRTLELAHSRGVVHRDIKPENVMVGGFGEVYVLDWGIATTAGEGAAGPIVGTPVYMAPEMVRGAPVDARTDVYLLGATLHEMLTGRPRHEGKTMVEVVRAAMLSRPYAYPPSVPEELAALATRCTRRDPAERPASAAAVREAILAFLRHRTARALADTARGRLEALLASLAADPGPPADLARAYRLLTEARFGFAEAAREDDAGAKEELRRCAVAAVELELRQDHVDLAGALLEEVEPPDAALAARIEERRARVAERARERERLERLDRELDPTANAADRTVPIVVLAIMLAGIGSYVAMRGPTITPESMVAAATFGMVVLLVSGALLHRRLLTNAFNRRAAALVLLGMSAALVNRLFGLVARTPPDQTIYVDLMLFAALMTAGAITLLRGLWACVLVLVAGVALVRAWPSHAPVVFSFTSFVNFLVGAAVLARARRAS